jgi:ribosome-binding protein aMBF1 (putative translation factor)
MTGRKKDVRHRKPRAATSASDILYRRYIKGNKRREKAFSDVAVEMSLGQYIRDLRERLQVTQQQLAALIGTQRSAISRLESADYQGHSIELLCRIVKALEGRLVMRVETAKSPSQELVLVA